MTFRKKQMHISGYILFLNFRLLIYLFSYKNINLSEWLKINLKLLCLTEMGYLLIISLCLNHKTNIEFSLYINNT